MVRGPAAGVLPSAGSGPSAATAGALSLDPGVSARVPALPPVCVCVCGRYRALSGRRALEAGSALWSWELPVEVREWSCATNDPATAA